MLTYQKAQASARVFQQLTGLTVTAFQQLLLDFEEVYQTHQQPRAARQRRPGGGRKSALPTCEDKLLFLLFYFRHYPTQETLAFLFSFSQGQANHWIHRLTPLVNQALGRQLQLPARRPRELADVLAACSDLEFLIDGTERPIRRPQDKERRKQDYSGKKKRHTKKNIVITEKTTGQIKGLGATYEGRTHDKSCVDDDAFRYPCGSRLYQDTGFQGYTPKGVTIIQPKKKPKGQELSAADQEANRLISRVRVQVEHSIGGIKIFGIVHDIFRNMKKDFVDLVMETACGLFNLRRSCAAKA